jgi:hypothetical protein
MAAPRNSFGTHHCNPFVLRKLDQFIQISPELRRLHIIGEATEAGVMPSGVEGISLRMPEAAQAGHVPVVKTSGMQANRQWFPVELRVVARTRNGAHIDQSSHIVRLEKMDEPHHWAGRMPYRHDNQRCWRWVLLHATHPDTTSQSAFTMVIHGNRSGVDAERPNGRVPLDSPSYSNTGGQELPTGIRA